MIKALKLNLRFLLIMLFMVTSTFPEVAESGFVKKRVQKKVRPRPDKWRGPPSPPIKTPSKSPIVADSNPYRQCRATVMPSFINRSMSSTETTYRSLKALSPPSIVVNSAGNAYPKPVSKVNAKMSKEFNAILVGSMSPEGIKSKFSQEGEAVTIMAPSDHYLTSATSTGHYRKYGGTSGATPLVTGSLAGFEWIAGYHPTAEEAKILLAKTAIPTPYSSDKPQKNGAGMVNAYKLAMVGKQLKKTCGKNISCFKDQIRKNDIYQFPEDKAVSEALDKAFPYCSSTCTAEDLKTPPSCAKKAKAFKNFRKQAFLNPQNKNLWKKIACVYAQGGFEKNKTFALNIYNSISGKPPQTIDPPPPIGGHSCKKDSDCVLAPSCNMGIQKIKKDGSSSDIQNPLLTLNRDYQETHYLACVEHNGKIPLCNGKCRCDSQEKVSPSSAEAGHIATASCVDSKCIITKDYIPSPPLSSPPNPGGGEVPPPESGGSGGETPSGGSSGNSGAVK